MGREIVGDHVNLWALRLGGDDAGFTPLEALQTATINPARSLDRLDDFGSIERGKVADMVVLNRDPTVNIANTRTIAGVVTAGRYLTGERIQEVLRDVEGVAARQ